MSTKTQRIIRDCYEVIHPKISNYEELNKLLELRKTY